MDFNLNFHPLDNLIKDKSSFWLEALVPFVDYKYKKLLIIYIKYKELKAILDCLEDIEYVESHGFNCKAHSMDDVITGLTGFMPKDFSDNIVQMKSMLDMMQTMNQLDGFMPKQGNKSTPHHNPNLKESDDLFDNIKSILDQEY